MVLMATHDPLLALSAHRRLVIGNGGIQNVLETTDEERNCVRELAEIDRKLGRLRERIRRGEQVGSASDWS